MLYFMGTTFTVPQVQEVLARALTADGAHLTEPMRAQIATLRGVSGPVTMLELDIPAETPTLALPGGQSSGTYADVAVVDAAGNLIGGILLWIAEGHLSTLEYYWYTGDLPVVLPTADQLVAPPAH